MLPHLLGQDEALSQRRQLQSLFAKDTADAYRVFDTMEHFLRQPEHLRGQLQVQLGGATQVHAYVRVSLPAPILLPTTESTYFCITPTFDSPAGVAVTLVDGVRAWFWPLRAWMVVRQRHRLLSAVRCFWC